MKLGLFGTIVGFIMMLAPIAGLNGDDQAAIKSSMTLMSAGMAVAMYTTLAGLVGSEILDEIPVRRMGNLSTSSHPPRLLAEVDVVDLLERART